jgi:hypothetical protein
MFFQLRRSWILLHRTVVLDACLGPVLSLNFGIEVKFSTGMIHPISAIILERIIERFWKRRLNFQQFLNAAGKCRQGTPLSTRPRSFVLYGWVPTTHHRSIDSKLAVWN